MYYVLLEYLAQASVTTFPSLHKGLIVMAQLSHTWHHSGQVSLSVTLSAF